MFKFLRKYNKLLLAIFGVLLMITFLIPQAIDNFAGQAGASRATIATVGEGERISGDKWQQVQNEVHLLQKMGARLPGSTSNSLAPEHWYLLTREAEAAGLVGTGGAVNLDDQTVVQLANASGIGDLQFIRQTIAKLAGVEQMVNLYQSGGIYSDRRLKSAAERLMHQVVAQVVVLEADDQVDYEPTQEQIIEQFEKYADVDPDTGEDGFGYRLPDRVKLEWLEIPADSVRNQVRQSSDFNRVAQLKHWRRHEGDPTKGFPPRSDASGEQVPQVVQDDLLNQLTEQKLTEIAKFASDQLRMNRRGIPEKDGYAVLPENWNERKLSFEKLASDIQSRFGIALPIYQTSGADWISVKELDDLGDIASATSDKLGAMPVSFTQLVQSTREFETDPVSGAYIQSDVAGPPLEGADGSIYIFRIIAADPARKPQSLDEVRDKVVSDLKRKAKYEQLAQSTSAIEQQAETEGLLQVALAHDTSVQPPASVSLANRFLIMQLMQMGQPPQLTPTSLPVIGQHRETVEAILDYALTLPSARAEVSVNSLAEEQRVFVVPVPDRLAVLVLRINQQNPLTKEDFESLMQNGSLQMLLAREEVKDEEPADSAFALEALKRRHNFAFASDSTQEESAADAPAPDAAAKAN